MVMFGPKRCPGCGQLDYGDHDCEASRAERSGRPIKIINMKTANSQMDTMPMTDRPTVEQALRYVENGKICDPYVLLDVLAAEVKRLRASQLFPASGDMVSCDPAPNAARGFPAHGVGRTYKL